MAFSTFIRSPATSALVALVIWLILSLFWSIIAPLIAGFISPIDPYNPMTLLANFETQQAVSRLSPQTLYGEISALLLDPAARSVGPLFMDQLQGAVIGAHLPTIDSLLIIWPQIWASSPRCSSCSRWLMCYSSCRKSEFSHRQRVGKPAR